MNSNANIIRASLTENDVIIEARGDKFIKVDTPVFTGPYTVDPSVNTQTLHTEGKKMTADLTVNPMPPGSVEDTRWKPLPGPDTMRIQHTVTKHRGYIDDGIMLCNYDMARVRKTVTPSLETQIVTPDSNTDYLSRVTVNPMPEGSVTDGGWQKIQGDPLKLTLRHTANKSAGYIEGGSLTSDYNFARFSQTVTPTTSQQVVNDDIANDRLLKTVTVKPIPSEYIIPTGEYEITTNGEYDITQYATVDVDVPEAVLQRKSVIYTPAAIQQTDTITPTTGFNGLSKVDVTVNAMPAGSVVVDDYTFNISDPFTFDSSTGTITSNSLISHENTATVTPGYVSTISGGETHAYLHKTQQLSTQAAATITPSGSQQTAVAAGKYTTGDVVVDAVPAGSVTAPSTINVSGGTFTVLAQQGNRVQVAAGNVSVTPNVTTAGYISSGTAGNTNITLRTDLVAKTAQTYHPSTSDQTIAANNYLAQDQTIKGVTLTNLTAGNIKKDVVVKIGDSSDDDCVTSVTGTYEGGGGNDFVITFAWDDDYLGQDEGAWVPGCTWAELQAAYRDGKTIATVLDNTDADVTLVFGMGSRADYAWDDGEGNLLGIEFFISWFDMNTDAAYSDNYSWWEDSGDVSYDLGERDPILFPLFETVNKTYTPSGTQQTDTITYDAADGYNGLEEVNITINAVPAGDGNSYIHAEYRDGKFIVSPYFTTTTNGYIDQNFEANPIPEVYNYIPSDTTITPTTSAQTIGGANVMLQGAVTVAAMPTMTLPDSLDGSSTGTSVASFPPYPYNMDRYLNIPVGYNATAKYYTIESATLDDLTITAAGTYSPSTYSLYGFKDVTVASGTAGTPTAAKGTASNHSIAVTPSVTNTSGYIAGSTINGTAVTVSASELVSGNLAITSNGSDIDVTNYETVSVNVSSPVYPDGDNEGWGSTGISDLTGTAWYFNANPDVSNDSFYSLNFTSNNQSKIELDVMSGGIIYTDSWAYRNGAWTNAAYRTISITGGTDATNATLIAWLQANATQQ